MNVAVEKQIRASDMDRRITSLQLDKKVHWNTEKPKTRAYRSTKIDKMLENSTYQSKSQKIYASMAHISFNA